MMLISQLVRLFPLPHRGGLNKARGILRLSRSNLTLLIRAITNHNFLGAHQNTVDSNSQHVAGFAKKKRKPLYISSRNAQFSGIHGRTYS